jgi:hypothetical protein
MHGIYGVSGRLEPGDNPNHPLAFIFADVRRERRVHYATQPPPKTPRRRAIITIVHNEPVFFPIWLGYYSRFFASDDIYVLDNDTSDGSTSRDGFVRIPAAHDRVDVTWMRDRIQELQHELLGRYDVVVATDVDEIIAPAPEFGTLDRYLDRFDEEWVNCLGYELLHMKELEPPLRLDRPIMSQRRHWFYNTGYDKAAVATVPMEWKVGLHGRTDGVYNLDPDLRLIHLHRMDYGLCLDRHRLREARAWAALDDANEWSVHNKITDEVAFQTWFYEDSCFEDLDINLEEIPDPWRDVF